MKANNDINLEVRENEIIGLIGETGCGKSILGRAIIRLLSDNVKIGGKCGDIGKLKNTTVFVASLHNLLTA